MARGRSARLQFVESSIDALLVLIALFAPLSMGAVHRWSYNILVSLVGLALLLTLILRVGQGRSLRWPSLAFWPLALALIALSQLLPLPPWLLAILSPQAQEIAQISLAPLGVTGWRPISLDPPATWRAVSQGLLYAALIAVAYQRSREPHGWRKTLGAVALSAVAVLLFSVVMTLGQVAGPYGLYHSVTSSWLVTPFVNPNHAGAFFGLGTFACTAMAVSQRDRSKLILWSLSAVSSLAAVALTLSRGAMLAMLAALLFVGWLLYSRRRRPEQQLWPFHLGVAAAIAIATDLAYAPIARELGTIFGKLDQVEAKQVLWRNVLHATSQFWLTGMGRGAFTLAFPRYKTLPFDRTFEFVENAPLQLLIDIGWPLALLLMAAAAVFYVSALIRARKVRHLLVLAGLFFVAVQNLADFSLEIPGLGVAVSLLLASVAPRRSAGLSVAGRRIKSVWRLSPRALFAPAGLALVLMLWALFQGQEWGKVRRQQILAMQSPAQTLRQQLLKAIARHPADYALLLALARTELIVQGASSPRALFWLGRSIALNASYGPSYDDVARLLWRRGARQQALENWCLAVTFSPALQAKVTRQLLACGVKYPELAAGLPEDQQKVLCRALWNARRGDEARRCINDRLQVATDDLDAMQDAGAWALAQGDDATSEAYARQLMFLAPRDQRGPLLLGKILMRAGAANDAQEIWQGAIANVEDPRGLLRELFSLALRSKDFAAARVHLEKLQPLSRRSIGASAAWQDLNAQLYLAQGQVAKALRAFRVAQGLAPKSLHYGLHVAGCEERLGQAHRALLTYQKLVQDFPKDPTVAKAIKRLQSQTQQSDQARRERKWLDDPDKNK